MSLIQARQADDDELDRQTVNERMGIRRPDYTTADKPILSFTGEDDDFLIEVLLDGSQDMERLLREAHVLLDHYDEVRVDLPGGNHYTLPIYRNR